MPNTRQVMKRTIAIAGAATLFFFALAGGLCALDPGSLAEGAQSAAPLQIVSGTRLLIGLRDSLSTKTAKAGDRFTARTLEPLPITDGTVLAPGAEVRGHVDKVEAAHRTGHARMWLTFDDLHVRGQRAPLVAQGCLHAPGPPLRAGDPLSVPDEARANGDDDDWVLARVPLAKRRV